WRGDRLLVSARRRRGGDEHFRLKPLWGWWLGKFVSRTPRTPPRPHPRLANPGRQKRSKALGEIHVTRPKQELIAERTGFEPVVENYPHTALANRRYRPLSHLSGAVRYSTDEGYSLRSSGARVRSSPGNERSRWRPGTLARPPAAGGGQDTPYLGGVVVRRM